MFVRCRCRRLGPASAWLGVAFCSSESPRWRRSVRHSCLCLLSRGNDRWHRMRPCGRRGKRKRTGHKSIRSRTDGTPRHQLRQRRRGLESASGTSSQRRVSANLLAARADRGAIQGINFALHIRVLFRKCRRGREISKEKIMKTVFATLILAIAIASPALAQRSQSAPKQGYQQNGYYNGYPLSEWYRTDEW